MENGAGVSRDAEGKIKLHQAINLTAAGPVGGGFWGMLIGMTFLNPLVGAAVGAGAGAYTAHRHRHQRPVHEGTWPKALTGQFGAFHSR